MQLKEIWTGGNDEGMEEDGDDGDMYLKENTATMAYMSEILLRWSWRFSQQGTSDVQT
mgnify:CR=1 FL=1